MLNRELPLLPAPLLEEQPVAAALFDFLRHEGVRYCVLGDTSGLPERVESDVDIVVEQRRLASMPALLSRFCSGNLRIVQYYEHEHTARFFVLEYCTDNGKPAFLNVDICGDFLRNGKRLLSSEDILSDRAFSRAGFYVPSSDRAFIYYLLKKVDKQVLNCEQGAYLTARWMQNPAAAAAQINRFWGGADLQLLANAARTGEWQSVKDSLPALRKALHSRLGGGMHSTLVEMRRAAYRASAPTGLFVAFLGPDGAGKTTLIQHIEKRLAPVFRRTECYHLRPHFGRSKGVAIPVTDPHAASARGFVLSNLKLALWWVDYWFGFVRTIYPRLVRSTLVIFDRYFYDMLVDPVRYRYGGSLEAARWASSSIPSPHLIFLLDAPVDVLQARKREVTPEEAERQRAEYLALVQDLQGSHVVDASRPVDEVVQEVERTILAFMASRASNRLHLHEVR